MRKLFVIIVTYNGEKWIRKCLLSIYNSTTRANVIIVDNGSTDNTLSIIRKEFADAELIISKSNLGFGKANNIGIRMALDRGATYVYLLNQDAWVEPTTFDILIEEMERNPKWGILSPLQVCGSGMFLDKNFLLYAVGHNERWISDAILEKSKAFYKVDFVMAAHWMLRSDSLKVVGGFSPIFPHYGEDNNLIHRYQFHGYEIGVCTSTRGFHDREFRKTTVEHNVYIEYINLLVKWNNICKKGCAYYITDFFYFLRRICKESKFGIYLIAYYLCKSLRNIPATLRNKKITRLKNCSYYDCDD